MISINKNNLIFTCLILLVIISSQIDTQINTKIIFFFVIFVSFLFLFIEKIFLWFLKKKLFFKILFIYFILHPFFILITIPTVSFLNVFLSHSNIMLQIFIIIFIYESFDKKNYKYLFCVLQFFVIFFFLEYLLTITELISIGSTISQGGREYQIVSALFKSQVYVSQISLISLFFLLNKILSSKYILNKEFVIKMCLLFINLFVIFVTFQRTLILCIGIYLLLYFLLNGFFKIKNIFYIILFSILSLIFINFSIEIRPDYFTNLKSIFERFIIWANALDIFLDHILIGTGAHNEKMFFLNNSNYIFNMLGDYLYTTDYDVWKSRIIIFEDYNNLSTHSTHIDLLIFYGMLGLVSIFIIYLNTIKFIFNKLKLNDPKKYIVRNSAISFISISFYAISLSMTQDLWLIMIPYIYANYLHNYSLNNKRIN